MTAGLFVGGLRPASKKAVREALAANPADVRIENTDFLGGGSAVDRASDLQVGDKVVFVGPDPYTNRRFYGTIVATTKGLIVK
jgi:hypothetical protein